jgi:hypothetical protein
MANPTPSAVTNATDWKFQNSYIERLMDHAALTAAHPDDTLILAGPPRFYQQGQKITFEQMLPIGMVQQMQVTMQKPTVPAMAIGSGRGFYLSGKAQGTASIARLFVNGRNLLRALMSNAIVAGIDVTKFDDIAGAVRDAKFFTNLDSELFLIPFGMAVLFRDKVHNDLGAFYMELCMINTWSIAVGAGQNMIMENVNMLFDRALPITAAGAGSAQPNNKDYYPPNAPEDSKLFDSIFGGRAEDLPPAVGGLDTVANNPYGEG